MKKGKDILKKVGKRTLQLLGVGGTLLLDSIENGLDLALEKLAGKDHDLQGEFAKESSILSVRNTGFNLTGKKRISNELSRTGVLVAGNTGSGKSSVSILPSILQANGFQINNDPSKGLFIESSGSLHQSGTELLQLDLADPLNTQFYNPLTRAKSLSELNQLATILVAGNSKKGKKDFWENSGIGALVAVFRIQKLLPEEYQNLYTSNTILELLSNKESRTKVLKLVAMIECEDAGLEDQVLALLGSGKETLPGILSTTRASIQMFSLDEKLAMITSRDTLGDFKMLRKGKSKALFIHSSTTKGEYYAPIVSIFISQYFDAFFEELPDKTDNDFYFHGDEIPLMKGVDNLSDICANVRKYRGNMLVAVQNIAQLVEIYGKEKAQSILSNLKTKLILSADLSMAKQLEQELGKYQFEDEKTGRKEHRSLMTADEIMCLPENKGLITVSGKRPILAKLTPYYKIPKLRRLTQLPPHSGSYPIAEGEDLRPKRFNLEEYFAWWKTEQLHPDNGGAGIEAENIKFNNKTKR